MSTDTALPTTSEMVPASPMMEAVWWVHHRAKNKSVYNLTWRLSCDRALDVDALGIAWQAVVDRYEALRSTLHQRDGGIWMSTLDHVDVAPQWITIADPGLVPVPTLLKSIAEEIQERPFLLDRMPSSRLTFVTVGDRHELLLTLHHAFVDGWGVQLLMGDLDTAYRTALAGGVPTFDTEPASLREYARGAHAARYDGSWDASLAHWRATLEGAATTTLIADQHRYTGTGSDGTVVRYALSKAAVDGVAALAKEYFATPFVIILAALQTVLARAGGGPEVCTGVVTLNRSTQEEQALVGYLANLVLVRTRADADETFGAVVERTRDDWWGSLGHHAVPFATVFGALTPSAQAKLRDSIPVLLNYLGPIGNGLTLGDATLHLLLGPNRAARTDLGIGILEDDGGYLIDCEYNTGRYERETTQRLFVDMDTVLAIAAVDPSRKLSTIDIKSKSGPAYVEHKITPADLGTTEMPRSTTLDQVVRAWTEVLGSEPVGPDEDFFATGGRSLKVVQLCATIEAETGVALDVVQWLADPTPRRAAEQIAAGEVDTGGNDGTLVELRAGAGPHVHLLTGAGGGVQDYRELVAGLPADWRVTASQERTPLTSVPSMAQRFRADLDAAGSRPDLLVGWSMGGQIAFEMAAGYSGVAPAVAVIDATPPMKYELPDTVDDIVYETFATAMAAGVGVILAGTPARTSVGDPELTMCALAAHLSATGSQRVTSSALVDRWATFQRHTLAVMTYVTEQRIGGPALVVGAELEDFQLDQWAARFRTPPRIMRVEANHYGALRPPVITEIAEAIGLLRAATPA